MSTEQCLGHFTPVSFGKKLNDNCIGCARRDYALQGTAQPYHLGVAADGTCKYRIEKVNPQHT